MICVSCKVSIWYTIFISMEGCSNLPVYYLLYLFIHLFISVLTKVNVRRMRCPYPWMTVQIRIRGLFTYLHHLACFEHFSLARPALVYLVINVGHWYTIIEEWYWWNGWADFQAVCFKLKINHYGRDLYKVLCRMRNIIFYIQWERRAPPIRCHSFLRH